MILFALTMINDVGTDGLSRFSSSNWPQTVAQRTSGNTDGLLVLANDVTETLYLEPTTVTGTERYLITTLRLRNMTITSVAPTLSVFGMQFLDGKDPFGVAVGFRVLDLCVVQDTTTGDGAGYINGRYVGTFPANRLIQLLGNSGTGSISFRISNMAVYSASEPNLMKPFLPTSIALGNDQTDWEVTSDLETDLGKVSPIDEEPSVTSRVDGAQIRIPASGRVLVEAAGAIDTSAKAHVEVQGQTLALGNTQGPAKTLLVDSVDTVTVTRVPD